MDNSEIPRFRIAPGECGARGFNMGTKHDPLPPSDVALLRGAIEGRYVNEFTTEIDFDQPLETMIAAGKYDRVNSAITPDMFPVEGTGVRKFRNKLFYFDDEEVSSDVVGAKSFTHLMQREGFAPATHVHGLAFGAAFPDVQRDSWIVCFGSLKRINGIHCGLVLYSSRVGLRCLGLAPLTDYPYMSFLGIQKIHSS